MKERIDRIHSVSACWTVTLRVLLITILLTVFTFSVRTGSGQSLNQDTLAVSQNDRAVVRVRYPNAEKLHDLQTDHDYQYGNDAPPPENPFARFLNLIFREISVFLASKAYQNVWQYVLLAIVAGFVIYLLMKAEVLGYLLPKKALADSLDYENLAENIHEINFDTAVEEAIHQRNFRLAVRLLYLQALKRLTDAGQIDYKPDKTNRQYVYELAQSPFQASFEGLTRQFEFVWYGDFPLDELHFQTIQSQFRQFGAVLQPSTSKP